MFSLLIIKYLKKIKVFTNISDIGVRLILRWKEFLFSLKIIVINTNVTKISTNQCEIFTNFKDIHEN